MIDETIAGEDGRQSQGCLGFLARIFGSTAGRAENQDSVVAAAGYRLRDDFLSPAELAFLRVLRLVLPESVLAVPKVNLGDLFYVPRSENHWAARNRINRRHVDFLVCDAASMRPLFGVELDDRSHSRQDRQERDALVDGVFASAGLPLVRVPAAASYAPVEIQALVEPLIRANGETVTSQVQRVSPTGEPPRCPRCGSAMVLRTARTGGRAGSDFWGCTNYPSCRGIVNV